MDWVSDRQLRWAAGLALALMLVYAGGAALAVPGVVKSQEMAKSNRLGQVEAPGYAAGYLLGGIWQRFDTVWYLEIAERGYEDPQAVVFYPLYPLLIRGLSALGLGPLWAALLIGRLATVALLWGLVKLLELDLGERAARWTVVWLLAWPSGFMLFAAYPDSMMMALGVWAFLLARRGQWWGAGLCAALGCTTKAAGAAVVAGLLVMCWKEKEWRMGPLLMGLAGAVLYPGALWLAGLPQPAEMYVARWKTIPSWPWETLAAAVTGVAGSGDVMLGFDLVCLTAAALLVWRKQIQPGYTAYAAALLVLFLTKKTDPLLQSTMRYVLAVFPAFAAMGAGLRDPYARAALLAVMVVLQGVFLFAFWMWSLVV